MKGEIHECAIELAKAHARVKYNVEETRRIYPDRNLYTLYADSTPSANNVVRLVEKYSQLLAEFQKRFHEEYKPLIGRWQECYGDMSCTLLIDGVNYERQYTPPKDISFFTFVRWIFAPIAGGVAAAIFVQSLFENSALQSIFGAIAGMFVFCLILAIALIYRLGKESKGEPS